MNDKIGKQQRKKSIKPLARLMRKQKARTKLVISGGNK